MNFLLCVVIIKIGA